MKWINWYFFMTNLKPCFFVQIMIFSWIFVKILLLIVAFRFFAVYIVLSMKLVANMHLCFFLFSSGSHCKTNTISMKVTSFEVSLCLCWHFSCMSRWIWWSWFCFEKSLLPSVLLCDLCIFFSNCVLILHGTHYRKLRLRLKIRPIPSCLYSRLSPIDM